MPEAGSHGFAIATCWRSLKCWAESGPFAEMWIRLLQRLDDLQRIDWTEELASGTFALAKIGGACVGKTTFGDRTKIMVLSGVDGIPLAAEIHSASLAEVTLIESLLDEQPLLKTPQRSIYDMTVGSDPFRARLSERGIGLICPHRKS